MADQNYYQRLKVYFSGKRADFPKYKIQLKATLGMTGWASVLEPSFKATMPATESTACNDAVPAEKAANEARVKNAKVVNCIIIGQKSDKMINMIELAKTVGYPSGVACLI